MTVQGPVKKLQPDGMSHRGAGAYSRCSEGDGRQCNGAAAVRAGRNIDLDAGRAPGKRTLSESSGADGSDNSIPLPLDARRTVLPGACPFWPFPNASHLHFVSFCAVIGPRDWGVLLRVAL